MTITGAVLHPAEPIRLREVHQSMKEAIQLQRPAGAILPPGAAVMTAIIGATLHRAGAIPHPEAVHPVWKDQVQRQAEVILPPGAAAMTATIGATLHRAEAIPQPEAHQSMKEVIPALRLQGAILHQGAVHPVWKGQLQPLPGVPCLRLL